MKLVKIERDGRSAQGFLEGDTIHVVGAWQDIPADMASFSLSAMSGDELRTARETCGETVSLGSVRLAPPIDPLRKILCVGVNYRDHAGEINADEPENPMIFMRMLESLVGQEQPIVRPIASERFDFEGEIAIVIGREAHRVSLDEARAHVGGYTCFMDGSVRDYQRQSLIAGKNFHRSGSMGPWIVTADEFDVPNPKLETRLNSEIVQSAREDQMIFGISEIIEYCSRWTVLRPGDVIATGTPGGVGSRRTPPLWMKPGDRIEVEVEGVGLLANAVIDEC